MHTNLSVHEINPHNHKLSYPEEVLEENTKEAEGPVAQATAAEVPNELQQDESAAEEVQPTLETEPNNYPDPAQKLVRGEIGSSQYKT